MLVFLEMEKSEDIERRAKRSQRDAEQMRLQEEADQGGRDRIPRHVPETDANSEIDLTRHKHFLDDEGPPEDMRHLEFVDPETDDRVFALLHDVSNRACHTSYWAWKAQYGFKKANQDLGQLITGTRALVLPRN